MATYKHFYDLPVYATCREFQKAVTMMIRSNLPKEEKYLLRAQLLNAVRSVTANIAEGFGRFHYQENIQFCRQSRGSLAEAMEHIITAYDDGYIDKTALDILHQQYKRCLPELNKYIKYLQAAKAKPIINNE